MSNGVAEKNDVQVPAHTQKGMNDFWVFSTLAGTSERLSNLEEHGNYPEVKNMAKNIETRIFKLSDESNETRIVDLTELSLCASLLDKYDSTGDVEFWNDMAKRFKNFKNRD